MKSGEQQSVKRSDVAQWLEQFGLRARVADLRRAGEAGDGIEPGA
jgi:hypothetical protein